MGVYLDHKEIIPKSKTPEAMPEGIAVRYYIRWPEEAQAITPDSLDELLANLKNGSWSSVYLADDDSLEANFMQLESGGGLYALQFLKDNTGATGEEGAWWTTFDPQYMGSDEETDIACSDGQSIIFREYTTADRDAVMTAIEYFVRTGKLWNGIPWMKCWQEWLE